ncbi:hypothetical protein [Geothrix oryzisoli]|uniref:hypothetical protein n=1 Tax=Geothrix oryzisoli TaxID=2922721 RepID=UPI001FACD633|nr:hypothetical protein [Geothrix oryzisoli]
MVDTRHLAILEFRGDGRLLGFNQEAAHLTGHAFEGVADLRAWCRLMFGGFANEGAIEGVFERSLREGERGSWPGEFFMPFRTVEEDTRIGCFTIVPVGDPQSPPARFLIGFYVPSMDPEVQADPEGPDLITYALARIEAASRELLSMLEEEQEHLMSSALRIEDDPGAKPWAWDELFRGAFQRVQIWNLVGLIRNSTAVMQWALDSSAVRGRPPA